jgi:hypothetical protein
MQQTIIYSSIVLALGLLACDDSTDKHLSSDPVLIQGMREFQTFSTLDEAVAASDVVVEATVGPVVEGDLRGDDGTGMHGIQFSETELRIEGILSGSLSGSSSIIVESMGWTGFGRPIRWADGSTHNVHTMGERGIFHLVKTQRTDGRVIYRLTSSQGKLLVRPDGFIVPTRNGHDPIAHDVRHMNASELRSRIKIAALQAGKLGSE